MRCLFDPWIRDLAYDIPDPGSRIPDPGSQSHIFCEVSELAQIFFLYVFKNRTILNFVIFVATKNVCRTTNFFPPPLLLLSLDPRWLKIMIREKHLRSATLALFCLKGQIGLGSRPNLKPERLFRIRPGNTAPDQT